MANVVNDLRGGSRYFTILPSAARTATPNSQEYGNGGRRCGLIVVLDVTAVTSTPSIDILIEGVDRVSGKTWELIKKQAIALTGTTVLQVHPALTATAGSTAGFLVPPFFRVTVTHGNANSITYSVAGYLAY